MTSDYLVKKDCSLGGGCRWHQLHLVLETYCRPKTVVGERVLLILSVERKGIYLMFVYGSRESKEGQDYK